MFEGHKNPASDRDLTDVVVEGDRISAENFAKLQRRVEGSFSIFELHGDPANGLELRRGYKENARPREAVNRTAPEEQNFDVVVHLAQ